MSRVIIILDEAKEDLYKSKEWYESQKEGLGEKFKFRVIQTVDQVIEYPSRYSKSYGQYRKALVHKFPYFIYFSFTDTHLVIRRVLHAHSNSGPIF